ncbi:MAG: type II toxin-antitoxin system HicA family toxin [Candidatus Micrarchaeota archaeon]|nr:type II toxin-antitoxin system HicA family toxin [Candidatus Micrarchaeota archaeon]MDE1847576.1 type II toxin-antitoxin system HicA family toxin [Candidatus Micrarchaeota archaeon]MDE1864293.1 type II toxin-antitoxin system HicA family toxin [Candidatus Micrarchaeota archaeon]
MSRLVITPEKLLKVLVKYYGFRPVRQKGSHLFITDMRNSTTIPMHGGDFDEGTSNASLRQAKLKKEDIRKYV